MKLFNENRLKSSGDMEGMRGSRNFRQGGGPGQSDKKKL